jgi:hypothetical protein
LVTGRFFVRISAVLTLGWAVSSAFLLGCGKERVAECNKLIAVINEQQTHIDKATVALQKQPDSTSAIEGYASAMESAASAVEAVPLADKKLQGLQADYKQVLRRGGHDCRELAAALKAADKEKDKQKERAEKARQGLRGLEIEGPKVIAGVNAYCQGK